MPAHNILAETLPVCRRLAVSKQLFLRNTRYVTTGCFQNQKFDDIALANSKPFEQIPSLPMVPFLGTAWVYLPIIGKYDIKKQHLATIDKRRRLGDIIREKFGPLNMVISFNPDDMQVIFNHEGPYPIRGEFSSLKAYRESRKHWYKTNGLLLLKGKEWRDLRSKTQKHLMKPKAVQSFLNPMQDVARDFVEKMLKIRDDNKEIPNFLEELYKWALESVALIGLDTRLGCFDEKSTKDSDGQKMIDAVQTQFECMNKMEGFNGNIPFWKIFPTPTWKKFTRAGDTFTEIAFKYINRSLDNLKKHSESGEQQMTLLQTMLMTKDLDISSAMVTVADMLAAGIDTTSHSVGFLLYQLAQNPDKQELLYKEIDKFLPSKESRITPNIFNEMKYLKACMKESARFSEYARMETFLVSTEELTKAVLTTVPKFHPIIDVVARSIDHDVVFSGYRVPAGTLLVIGYIDIYRDEKYFTNPNQFLPERWLNKDNKMHPLSFVPFGVGPRSCIGRRIAELEIICLISEIMRKFKVEYHYEDIGMYERIINTPDKPLRFKFIER